MKAFLRRRLSDLKQTGALLAQAARTRVPRLAYVGGWLGHRNLGDEALLAAYRQLFTKCGLLVYPRGMSRVALKTSRWAQLCSTGVLAGGTLIGRSEVDALRPILDAMPFWFVFGTGVANPGFWSSRDPGFAARLNRWRPVLEQCRFVGVRGPMSAEILTDMGLSNVEVVGDPVLVFADSQCATNADATAPSLGLNVGQSLGRVWGREDSICEQYVRLAKTAKHHGWEVHWFVVWPDDLEITMQAAQTSGTAERIHQVYDDHTRFLDLVRPLTAFVGMKLHAVVLATCAYVPSVMVEYRPKCRDYMRSINQDDVTFRSDAFVAEPTWDIVKSWGSMGRERRESLYQAIQSLVRLQSERAEHILQTIKVAGDRVSTARHPD